MFELLILMCKNDVPLRQGRQRQQRQAALDVFFNQSGTGACQLLEPQEWRHRIITHQTVICPKKSISPQKEGRRRIKVYPQGETRVKILCKGFMLSMNGNSILTVKEEESFILVPGLSRDGAQCVVTGWIFVFSQNR